MNDWRTLMQAPPRPSQYPQNPQKGVSKESFEDFEYFEHEQEPPRAITPAPDEAPIRLRCNGCGQGVRTLHQIKPRQWRCLACLEARQLR